MKPTNRRLLAPLVYVVLLGLQITLVAFVRGHGPGWFAGGNSPSQTVSSLSSAALGAALLVEVILCGTAVWLVRRSWAWMLLPLPLVLLALGYLSLAANGPAPAA